MKETKLCQRHLSVVLFCMDICNHRKDRIAWEFACWAVFSSVYNLCNTFVENYFFLIAVVISMSATIMNR